MCGRFTLTSEIKEIRDYFAATNQVDFSASYNISPGRDIPIVRREDGSNELALCRWGLVPHWSKSDSKYQAINARAETLADKPFFRDPFKKRRCLIPANGFYEWQKKNGAKQAYYFHLQNAPLFAFAGLWDHWQGGQDELESCAIITTAANDVMRPVHDRMPVILTPESYVKWLEKGAANLLLPFAGELECNPVGQAVNNPQNDGAELIKAAL